MKLPKKGAISPHFKREKYSADNNFLQVTFSYRFQIRLNYRSQNCSSTVSKRLSFLPNKKKDFTVEPENYDEWCNSTCLLTRRGFSNTTRRVGPVSFQVHLHQRLVGATLRCQELSGCLWNACVRAALISWFSDSCALEEIECRGLDGVISCSRCQMGLPCIKHPSDNKEFKRHYSTHRSAGRNRVAAVTADKVTKPLFGLPNYSLNSHAELSVGPAYYSGTYFYTIT